MIKINFIKILIFAVLLITGCSTFIPDAESNKLSLKYQAGEYVLLSDLSRNKITFPKNSILKLLVTTGKDWIKIYAYNSNEELLLSRRLLLLYMFETDFPDEKFSQQYLDAELSKLVILKDASYKPSADTKKTEKNTKKNKKSKKGD